MFLGRPEILVYFRTVRQSSTHRAISAYAALHTNPLLVETPVTGESLCCANFTVASGCVGGEIYCIWRVASCAIVQVRVGGVNWVRLLSLSHCFPQAIGHVDTGHRHETPASSKRASELQVFFRVMALTCLNLSRIYSGRI